MFDYEKDIKDTRDYLEELVSVARKGYKYVEGYKSVEKQEAEKDPAYLKIDEIESVITEKLDNKDLEELMDLASSVCSIASSECCGDGHGKFWTCEECSCQDGYLDHDENGKAFFHKLGTCDIHRCSQKINELIEKGYDPWKEEDSENV